MINFIIFVVSFYLILISIIGYGYLVEKFFFRKIVYLKNSIDINIYTGFYSLALLTIVSLITSLFVPHNYLHNLIIFFFGLFLFFKNFYFNKNLRYIFLISFFLLSALFISKTNEDFPYYHLPYTMYLVENKIIFGMGNLVHGYNYFSSLFFLNSTFVLPFIDIQSYHFSSIYFLIFFNFFILKEINRINQTNVITILYLLAFTFYNLSFYRLAEFGTDKIGQFIIVIMIIKFIDVIIEDKKYDKVDQILPIIPIIGLCLSFKAYFFVYLVLGLLIFFIDKHFLKNFKKILISRFFFIFLIFIFLSFTHYFISTGCIIAPLKQLCFGEYFFWGRKIEEIESLSIWLEQWSKAGAGPNFRIDEPEVYIKGINWVSRWIKMYFLGKFTDQLGIFFATSIVVFFLFKLNKINQNFSFKKKFYYIYFCILIIFLVWFFKHPTLRYGGYSAFFLFLAIPISIFLSRYKNKKYFIKRSKILIITVIIIFNFKNISRIKNEFDRDDFYKYKNFPNYTVVKNKNENLKINKSNLNLYLPNPEVGSPNFCWKSKTPCGQISDQINVKYLNGYYFIYKTFN